MVVMGHVAQVLSDDSVSDKEALKTVNELVRTGSSGKLQVSSAQRELEDEPEVINGMSRLLVRKNSKLSAQACRALGTFSYGSNAVSCAVVRAPGMLDNLANLMETDTKESQLEAARLLCNCAAYSIEAAEEIAMNPAVLDALQKLCRSKDMQVKAKGVGCISTLSECPAALEVLKNTTIVEDCLMNCVFAKKGLFGNKDLFDAQRMDALTAIVNLDKYVDLSKSTAKDSLKTFKTCLEQSLKGKTWAGVSYSPYNSLVPLAKLSSSDAMKPLFNELKFVKTLCHALETCTTVAERSLALQCLTNLSTNKGCLKSMKKPKYNMLRLCDRQLSCSHSSVLAEYMLEELSKEVITSVDETETNDNTDTKDEVTEQKDDEGDNSSNDGEGEGDDDAVKEADDDEKEDVVAGSS
mmetsp:Transcript_57740/g.141645  ORF Transcript_57740/g.141645 Transcript_57740/m.141645 type:complete len:410 (-) Transcript_57740:365-1594(-)|eukprot:CAMPEP_0206251228 /NCGR_PEP_ID=MMETSP0047_2-20121206/21910_1 /ASSEMBLY_ACC=CAM_ASM_000192 /TAXON_ID=195065 /ORGANISM="Chroomonas mesostigmatica_cf, Strain CCMP1168" /LENGTH=409 /DNA_ID=CAMNT_0053677163 /DNA_START=64 /DNA_END=1293 /DNA_ORIENTATION=-